MAVIASLSALGFAGIFGGLWHQMAAARDPALGPKARAVAAASRQQANRRIVRRTIVIRKLDDDAPAAAAPPVTSQAAPVPAPAPSPPPVVTRVS